MHPKINKYIQKAASHILIFSTCEYFASFGNISFADVIKDLNMGTLHWKLDLSTRFLSEVSRRTEVSSGTWKCESKKLM